MMELNRNVPRPRLEVADLLRDHADEYERTHPVSLQQSTVLRRLAACRTAALGGHVEACDSCGHRRVAYNSCRDRHCPKCQGLKRAEWLERRKERLLPVPYFHVVFTLPDSVNPIVLRNRRVLLNLLFAAASQTLLVLARDERHLGAQIGVTAVLHTWGQNLLFHPHVHCVVTGGGLSADGTRWIESQPSFFAPVRVLGRLFRGKFLDGLQRLRNDGNLCFDQSTADLAQPDVWKAFRDRLYRTDWVVYAKPPFGGPEHVFRYLGRYTHRVAISNQRLVSKDGDRVSFKYRDSRDHSRTKVMSLAGLEFIRRFLLHVLPRGFVRIRHFGILASRNVATRLETARRILVPTERQRITNEAAQRIDDPGSVPWWERLLRLTGFDALACPCCGSGRMRRVARILVPVFDTS